MLMYKNYDELMEEKLDMISDRRDRRQGSLIYDALAPNSAEISTFYTELAMMESRTFGDTATGDDLTKRVKERGIYRKASVKATFYAEFFDKNKNVYTVPIGNRFALEDLFYVVIDTDDTGQVLECETAGEYGNKYLGELIPLEYMDGLAYATLTEVRTDGEDEESDDQLRSRYLSSFLTDNFGGNIADYKNKVMALQNVGGVKVYPVWNGGGTVKIVVLDMGYSKPTDTVINELQQEIDPTQDGYGYGIAPIGHRVTVVGVDEFLCNISVGVILDGKVDSSFVESELQTAFAKYFYELSATWEESSPLIVRISHLESAVLEIAGVVDVMNCTVNGESSNIMLGDDEIPVLAGIEVI